MFRYAKRLLGDEAEAEEAVQDAFLRLTRHRERLDGFASARAYIFRVVRNVCIDRKRALARRLQVISDDGLDADSCRHQAAGTPETDCLSAETVRRIVEAMNALPDVEAETLSLIVVEGLSYQETAAATDVPIGTVRSRLNRARRTLREVLQRPPSGAPLEPDTPTAIRSPRKIR